MISTQFEHDLKDAIRAIPGYPKRGIVLRDITTLLGNARAFRRAVDELVQPRAGMKIGARLLLHHRFARPRRRR
jgi:adenine phosphoribosyltransferase